MERPHQSVLLEESVQALAVDPNGTYVDATFGRGGHARAILACLGSAGRLIAIDRDPQALASAQSLAAVDPRLTAVHGRFGDLTAAVRGAGVTGGVAGILLDLGVSSPQLDTPERGFSFMSDGPLDMRMDPDQGESVAAWLARVDQAEIAAVLHTLGEERFAGRIARAIVATRVEAPIVTTRQLAELVARVVPNREPGKHPATRTFQALRIQINDELGELTRALSQVCHLLAAAGRLVVISFHSLEDRIVKRFIRDEARGAQWPKGLPVTAVETRGRLRPFGKPVRPSAAEVTANPRARSAILRVAERLA
ncbi:MAG TPA: 16S rRNA (cytosine(1402)-N(4))-methyltransferase RsmH [Lamprocystis sp. (in: g-proteobacteria)]|nr:16S rRNA (cytosine(1402)-N(4))-methyltransferase RsmH [Lamprocystis sp. (in: g-proteobacteria)]